MLFFFSQAYKTVIDHKAVITHSSGESSPLRHFLKQNKKKKIAFILAWTVLEGMKEGDQERQEE